MDAEDAVCAGLCSLRRSGNGLVKRYIEKVTGLSRAQVTRLIDRYVKSGILRTRRGRGRRFTARYTPADIALLAEVDEAHETRSGLAHAEESAESQETTVAAIATLDAQF